MARGYKRTRGGTELKNEGEVKEATVERSLVEPLSLPTDAPHEFTRQTSLIDDELCDVDLMVNDFVSGWNKNELENSLVTNSKSSSKKRKLNSALKTTPSLSNSLNITLDDILNEDQPLLTPVHGKSAIDDVFAQFMDKDPYASIGKFLPSKEKISPCKPLTLFSPNEKAPKRLLTPSAPQCCQRRSMLSVNQSCNINVTDSIVRDSCRALFFSPNVERRLGTALYSPVGSPTTKQQSLHSITLRKKLTEAQLNALASPAGCSTPFAEGERLLSSRLLSSLQAERPLSLYNQSISVSSTPLRPGHGSFPAYYQSPQFNIPENVKSTILLGIVCYVEVRYNKEDRSESVKKEVESLGATIEKNFTKKVTHIIFKEGKMSTFMKAKELKIPLVSLLWIEACKFARGLVDPAQFAPSDNDKYLREIPIEEERKRTRFLRRGQAFLDRLNGVLPRKPQRSNTKMATTLGKRKVLKEISNPKRTDGVRGRKKLDFNSEAVSGNAPKKLPDTDSDYGSDLESADDANEVLMRRKSAPGDLSGVGRREQKLAAFFSQKPKKRGITNQLLKTPPKMNVMTDSETEALVLLTGGYVSTNTKRRKLYNPNDSVSIDFIPSTPVALSPFIKDASTSKKFRSQSGSSKKNKHAQVFKPKTEARKSLITLMEREEDPSAHNSMSCFELDKKFGTAPKCEPRIAFTGLFKDDAEWLKGIIKQLGTFKVDPCVMKRTTHLVTSSPAKRTVNLLKALAQGCWILEVDWIHSSHKNRKWMLEEQFELKSFSEAVTTCRLERQAFGKDYCMDLFSRCGTIFVDSNVQPPRADLIELLKICRANIVVISTTADIIVSMVPVPSSDSQVSVVSPKWVLDSISGNKLLAMDQYKL